ncbi:KTSC domain-containing protein [Planktotalea sp.]|uniref:KTSC domain-containing protein n=1 Tax=Planktotalea sp. TaxID=2029877 RepID=UPI003299F0E1
MSLVQREILRLFEMESSWMSEKRATIRRSNLLGMLISAYQDAFLTMPADQNRERTEVQSRSIVSVAYLHASKSLQIEYLSGWIYEARNVPAALYAQLMQDDDFDRVFYTQIQNKFPMDRIGRLWPVCGW